MPGARQIPGIYESIQFSSAPQKIERSECKHPRVKIVAREEDTEFVGCVECGEVFESSEFKISKRPG